MNNTTKRNSISPEDKSFYDSAKDFKKRGGYTSFFTPKGMSSEFSAITSMDLNSVETPVWPSCDNPKKDFSNYDKVQQTINNCYRNNLNRTIASLMQKELKERNIESEIDNYKKLKASIYFDVQGNPKALSIETNEQQMVDAFKEVVKKIPNHGTFSPMRKGYKKVPVVYSGIDFVEMLKNK